jgi:hypothetical protein
MMNAIKRFAENSVRIGLFLRVEVRRECRQDLRVNRSLKRSRRPSKDDVALSNVSHPTTLLELGPHVSAACVTVLLKMNHGLQSKFRLVEARKESFDFRARRVRVGTWAK